jgi:hypothetical protein
MAERLERVTVGGLDDGKQTLSGSVEEAVGMTVAGFDCSAPSKQNARY